LRLEYLSAVVLKPAYHGMYDLVTWAYKQTEVCVSKDDSQEAPIFVRTARDFEDRKRGMKFSLKDCWAEAIMLLVAGELAVVSLSLRSPPIPIPFH
jgi:hypothetical protein